MSLLELRRQLIHASGVFIALFVREAYSFGGWATPAAALIAATAVGYGVSYLHKTGLNIPVLTKTINGSERETDRGFPGRGAIRFFTGALITLLIFRNTPQAVTAGIIVLALGDSASTLGGVNFGRHKIFYNREKSVEGTIIGMAAAFLGLMLLTPLHLTIAAITSFIGLIVESLPLKVDDNLTVPVSSALTTWILTTAIII